MTLRGTARAVTWLGWTLLGAVALLGLALSAVAFLSAVPIARTAIASAVVRLIDDAVAGSLKLEGIAVLPGGAIELRGLEVFDPDGHLVLAVSRARVSADVMRLSRRVIGIELEVEEPSVILEEEADGGVSLARAFAPAAPSEEPAEERKERPGGPGWTIDVKRFQVTGGELWWIDPVGATRLEAAGIDITLSGSVGPARTTANVRLRGEVHEPVASPVGLELAASLYGDEARVPLLHVEAGGSELSLVGEGNIARQSGRIAVTRLQIVREQARALVPSAPEGGNLRGTGYAESDGSSLTAALRVEPAQDQDGGGDGTGGRGDAAVAIRFRAGPPAGGLDLALDKLDPSRLVAIAPPGELTLSARGAASGTSLDDARARLALLVSRSRLRGGELSKAELKLRAER